MKALWVAVGAALWVGCGAPATGGNGGGSATGGGSGATGGGSGATGGGSGAMGGGSGAMGGGSGAMGGGSGAMGGGTGATGGGTGATGGGTGATGGGSGGGGTSMTPAPHGCITDVTSGHHKFMCDSVAYDVEVPTACAAGGCGLIVDIHGLTMTGDQEDKSTGMRALGRTNGYVVVQPTAPSDGILGPDWTPGTDDTKVWSVINDTRTALVIDPKRIHVMGFSQGGSFTWRLLCAHADVLASVAPVAAADAKTTAPYAPPYKRDCPFDMTASPSQQIPVLHMHGTLDGLVPFSKGTDQRDVALAAWGLSAPTPVSSDAKYTWTRYTGSNGVVYEWIQHDYLVNPPLLPVAIQGHCLAGGEDLAANASLGQTMWFSCAPPNGFVWGEAAMQFFIAHPKP